MTRVTLHHTLRYQDLQGLMQGIAVRRQTVDQRHELGATGAVQLGQHRQRPAVVEQQDKLAQVFFSHAQIVVGP